MSILSIQSHVSYGHVGNSAAVFPLQRIGHDVWPVHTVNFSNHTGYGDWGGDLIPADQVRSVIDGIARRGGFELIDAIVSGYQGGAAIAEVIIDAVARIKEANPDAMYVCDPVMGSKTTGCFVDAAIPPLLRDRVVPVADVITPNQFELGYLTGVEASDIESTLEAVDAARAMGPETVLVTSVRRPDAPENTIEMIAANGDEAFIVQTPWVGTKLTGTGDVTTALFAGHLVKSGSVQVALENTAASVFNLIEHTFNASAPELDVIGGQEAFVAPARTFNAEQIR
ncbi:pyridoxal kinase PdxY [Corynebacterium gerontici]|uniref:pyridoxal kinase n=1 Tax=Corynebacterium gerontici TaxID=2079234 RepID=A0A3G6J2F0_9CORY|nr:pyridoxal kinase PdxY [Corynebacterium gerontici]AZA11883.1 Pyridoxamine kinase [Corynebacterium gerontici]